jgi:LytR cell envelope-related transcriptional attenuator
VSYSPAGPPTGPPPAGPAAVTGRAGPAHSPRSGAHRPRRPLWHEIVPGLVVLLAVTALVFAVFALKDSVLGSSSTSSSGPSGPSVQDNQPAAPTAPTSGPSAGATASRSAPSTAAPTVNRSVHLHVWNSTSRTGLAKGAVGKLSGKGWQASSAGNRTGYAGGTAVFYAKASLKLTAKAVATDLGGYPARLSAAYGSGVVVILGSDYRP